MCVHEERKVQDGCGDLIFQLVNLTILLIPMEGWANLAEVLASICAPWRVSIPLPAMTLSTAPKKS